MEVAVKAMFGKVEDTDLEYRGGGGLPKKQTTGLELVVCLFFFQTPLQQLNGRLSVYLPCRQKVTIQYAKIAGAQAQWEVQKARTVQKDVG